MRGQSQEQSANAEFVEHVTVQRERFLRFISSRVEDKATAEDILQAAYLKASSEAVKSGKRRAWSPGFIAFFVMP
jgi:DNA-directed RNA polymerase specialized sigma24 family protein